MAITLWPGNNVPDLESLRHDGDPPDHPSWFNGAPLSDCPRCYEELRVVQMVPLLSAEVVSWAAKHWNVSDEVARGIPYMTLEVLVGILLPMIDEALQRRPGHIDESQIDLYGMSGSANGALRLGIHVPRRFSTVYALDGCVNVPDFVEGEILPRSGPTLGTNSKSARLVSYQGAKELLSCDPNLTAHQRFNKNRPLGQDMEFHLGQDKAHLYWTQILPMLLPHFWSDRECNESKESPDKCFGLSSTAVLWTWIVVALLVISYEVKQCLSKKWWAQSRLNLESQAVSKIGEDEEGFVVTKSVELNLEGQNATLARLGLVVARLYRRETFSAAVWLEAMKLWAHVSVPVAGSLVQQIISRVDTALQTPVKSSSKVDFLWYSDAHSPPLHAVSASAPMRAAVIQSTPVAELRLEGANAKPVAAALHCALMCAADLPGDEVALHLDSDVGHLLSLGEAPLHDDNVDPAGVWTSLLPVHQIVAKVACENRSRMAILGSDRLTYEELLGWAAQIAEDVRLRLDQQSLRRLADSNSEDSTATGSSSAKTDRSFENLVNTESSGCTPYGCVALLLPRGAALISAMLGVLRAGHAYVPLDVHAPEERWNTILADCKARLVLVDQQSNGNLSAMCADVLEISRPSVGSGFAAWGDSKAERSWQLDDVAAIYYTSGSSGRPKGVQVSHRYITYLSASIIISRGNHSGTVVAMYHSPTWMTCLDNVFSTFFAAGAVAIFPPSNSHKLDLQYMKTFLKSTGTTRISAVPVLADAFLDGSKDLTSLECVGVGGAAFPQAVARRMLRNIPKDCRICTAYAGTEYGDATFLTLTESMCEQGWPSTFVPGGKSHGWQSVFIVEPVLNDDDTAPRKLQLCSEGFAGEIAIAGPGLSSGYLNQAELNRRAFVPNPFRAEEVGSTLFLSGDLGAWENGQLRILGRVDNQVKVNGLRIELGEIEAVLADVPDVRSVAVVVLGNALVAYLEPANLVENELRRQCEKTLPPYMVPKTFVCLDGLPTLPSGKINRKALPAPVATDSIVEELDSLGMMRRFRVATLEEDRILDNIRSFLLCMVVVSHSAGGSTASAWDVTEAWANSWQQGVIIAAAGGGWLALSLASGFDDARALNPYAFQVREPLFIVLWFVGQRHWTLWFFPAFVLMRCYTILAHRLRCERFMFGIWIVAWLVLPMLLQLQPVPLPSSTNPVDTGPCVPVYDWPWFKTFMEWTFGDTAIRQGARTFLFAPCYWLGFYCGRPVMKRLSSMVNMKRQRRFGLLFALLLVYLSIGFSYGFGLELLESRYLLVPWWHKQVATAAFDDLCTSFYAKGLSNLPVRMMMNWLHLAVTVLLSCLYVLIVALAPSWHLKTLAKTSFPALILHGFVPCLLNIQGWCVDIADALGAGFHTQVIQMLIWFGVPVLFVWVVGQILYHMMRFTAVKARQSFIFMRLSCSQKLRS